MQISKEAITQLTCLFEGLRLQAYPDHEPTGILWTIGYGHTKGVKCTDTCTEAQAVEWLTEDIEDAESVVNTLLPNLSQNQFDAVVDFVFNLGATQFKRSTLLKKLRAEDYIGASKEFGRWVYDDGKKQRGLVRRREAERKWFSKDE